MFFDPPPDPPRLPPQQYRKTARSRSSNTKELASRRARGLAPTGSRLRSARRGVHRRRLCPLAVTGVDDAEHCRYEEQRRTGGEEQAADHRATERRVLAW